MTFKHHARGMVVYLLGIYLCMSVFNLMFENSYAA